MFSVLIWDLWRVARTNMAATLTCGRAANEASRYLLCLWARELSAPPASPSPSPSPSLWLHGCNYICRFGTSTIENRCFPTSVAYYDITAVKLHILGKLCLPCLPRRAATGRKTEILVSCKKTKSNFIISYSACTFLHTFLLVNLL